MRLFMMLPAAIGAVMVGICGDATMLWVTIPILFVLNRDELWGYHKEAKDARAG